MARVRCLRRLVWMFLLRLRSSHEEASNLPRGDGDVVATEDDGSAPQSTVAHASSAHARRRRGWGMMEMCNIGFPRARGESQLRFQLREKRMHRQRLASCGTVVRVTRAAYARMCLCGLNASQQLSPWQRPVHAASYKIQAQTFCARRLPPNQLPQQTKNINRHAQRCRKAWRRIRTYFL